MASHCDLKSLPELPGTLEELEVQSSGLRELPDLPAGLRRLDVSSNQLTRLRALPELTALRAGRNPLDRFPDLPATLCQLNLEAIGLSCAELPAMASLRELEVSFNPTEFPRAIAAYPALEKLFVVECGLGSVPDEVAELSRLSWLNLNVNQLRRLPEGLTRMPGLRLLYVKANLLGSLPDFRASGLTEVMVGGNPLTPAQIAGAFPPGCQVDSEDAGILMSRVQLEANLATHFGVFPPLVPLRIPAGLTIVFNRFREAPQCGEDQLLFEARRGETAVTLETREGLYMLEGQGYPDWAQASEALSRKLSELEQR